jgi:hypothetical protein
MTVLRRVLRLRLDVVAGKVNDYATVLRNHYCATTSRNGWISWMESASRIDCPGASSGWHTVAYSSLISHHDFSLLLLFRAGSTGSGGSSFRNRKKRKSRGSDGSFFGW